MLIVGFLTNTSSSYKLPRKLAVAIISLFLKIKALFPQNLTSAPAFVSLLTDSKLSLNSGMNSTFFIVSSVSVLLSPLIIPISFANSDCLSLATFISIGYFYHFSLAITQSLAPESSLKIILSLLLLLVKFLSAMKQKPLLLTF